MQSKHKVWCEECKLQVYECAHLGKVLDGLAEEAKTLADRVRDRPLVKPYRKRATFLTFGGTVAAEATASLVVQPQTFFKPKRLVVDPCIAPFFKFLDLCVGHCSQAAAYGHGVRCTVFPADPLDKLPVNNLDGVDACSVGQLLALSVVNVDPTSLHEFSAIIWGETVDF